MVGLCCWLVVHPLLNIDGTHMDDLCHLYHSWYTETETACPLHSSTRSTFDIRKTKRNPVTPTDSTTCPMTDRETLGGGNILGLYFGQLLLSRMPSKIHILVRSQEGTNTSYTLLFYKLLNFTILDSQLQASKCGFKLEMKNISSTSTFGCILGKLSSTSFLSVIASTTYCIINIYKISVFLKKIAKKNSLLS